MEVEKTSSKKPRYSKNVKIISIIGLIISFLGILDGIDLTIAHYSTPAVLACPDTGFINCAKVTTSSYSQIHGIPVALLGLIFFVIMFILQLPMMWNSASALIKYGRLAFSIIGLLSVFWFVYVEFHKLHAICLYCTGVHIMTFAIFVVTLIGTSIIVPKATQISE